MNIPLLPQNDSNPQSRQNYLTQQKSDYVYAKEPLLPPLPQLDDVPSHEDFDLRYQLHRARGLVPG
ncbi:hypothetical protein [Roseofilum casamattae]|uniref:Uncharacterized protein n=1 Tax=Roseofilum casamattae BLCC-M143 TaxID=3022442 RepID=A0ABT7BRF4_9CYAN|nr:hypothetical protein [Roseofilum casamattae]MDJ1181773.1 hypothetical protein [Roseofilum casamattae BLCC-M143]